MHKPLTRKNIVKDIEAFCAKHGLTPTEFGLKALNDGSFFGRLNKADRSPTLERIERVYEFMDKHDAENQPKKKPQGAAHDLLA